MIITINTTTDEIAVSDNEGRLLEMEVAITIKHLAMILRNYSEALHPPSHNELILNEDRLQDITQEMIDEFLSEHEGAIH